MTQRKSPSYRSTVALGATFPLTRRRWTCTYIRSFTRHVTHGDHDLTTREFTITPANGQPSVKKLVTYLSERPHVRVFARRKLHILQGQGEKRCKPLGSRWLMNLWWIRSPPFDQAFFPGSVYIGFRAISCQSGPENRCSNRQFSCSWGLVLASSVMHTWSHRQTRLTFPKRLNMPLADRFTANQSCFATSENLTIRRRSTWKFQYVWSTSAMSHRLISSSHLTETITKPSVH